MTCRLSLRRGSVLGKSPADFLTLYFSPTRLCAFPRAPSASPTPAPSTCGSVLRHPCVFAVGAGEARADAKPRVAHASECLRPRGQGPAFLHGTEIGIPLAQVAFERIKSQDDITELAAAVRHIELNERRPIRDDLGDRTVPVGEHVPLDIPPVGSAPK